jgi:rubredoxin
LQVCQKQKEKAGIKLKIYICRVCGYIYNESKGDPAHGIQPGTKWDEIPDNWRCPKCGETKDSFFMEEVLG